MIFLQILGAILIGFLVGALARLIVPGRERGGCLTSILIGIAGSFVAFFIGTYLFGAQFDRSNPLRPAGFISSLLGAILILIIYHWIRRRRQQ
ncbi:MAG TPA: GlsB/YeaQ/YmgE family stress response membrane protein [Chthoniobacterales bacterium]